MEPAHKSIPRLEDFHVSPKLAFLLQDPLVSLFHICFSWPQEYIIPKRFSALSFNVKT